MWNCIRRIATYKFQLVNSNCRDHSPICHCEGVHAFLNVGLDASVEFVVALQKQLDDCMSLVDTRFVSVQTSFFLWGSIAVTGADVDIDVVLMVLATWD